MVTTPLPREFFEAPPVPCPETQVLINGLIEAKPGLESDNESDNESETT